MYNMYDWYFLITLVLKVANKYFKYMYVHHVIECTSEESKYNILCCEVVNFFYCIVTRVKFSILAQNHVIAKAINNCTNCCYVRYGTLLERLGEMTWT